LPAKREAGDGDGNGRSQDRQADDLAADKACFQRERF
jgi:hypothetical protein